MSTTDDRPVNATPTPDGAVQRPRLSVSESGTLRIEDLQASDAGVYTCWCGRDAQTLASAWTAHLTVASPTNPNIVFVRRYRHPFRPFFFNFIEIC